MSSAVLQSRNDVTKDLIYGGNVVLVQPRRGYRVAIDPVLLAASVPACSGDRVLDVGVGTGAVSLCLAARIGGLALTGIDVEPEFLGLARQSADLNGVRIELREWDVLAAGQGPPADFRGQFDHVVTNPPFWEDGKGRQPSRASAVSASRMPVGALSAWIEFCAGCLSQSGTFATILPTPRLDEALTTLETKGFSIRVLPLTPHDGALSRRVILQASCADASRIDVLPAISLHGEDGRYTKPIDDVLRGRSQLPLVFASES